jgi:aspartate racemase
MNKPMLGVLGGIGPEASAYFYRRLIEKYQAVVQPKDNTEYPHVFINNIPAPDLIALKPDQAPPLEMYIEGLRLLEKAGAGRIAIVCNTAHVFLQQLQKSVGVPIINLPELVRAEVARRGLKTMVVLGTSTAARSRLYRFPGIKTLALTSQQQEMLDNVIRRYNVGGETTELRNSLQELLDSLLRQQVGVILGCTELSMLCEKREPGIIDPLELLINASIEYLRP